MSSESPKSPQAVIVIAVWVFFCQMWLYRATEQLQRIEALLQQQIKLAEVQNLKR